MASTQSADYWTGVRDNLTALALDFSRAKLIDVERPSDDRNIPDQADLRAPGRGNDPTRPAVAGLTAGGWALVAVTVIAGVVVLKKFL